MSREGAKRAKSDKGHLWQCPNFEFGTQELRRKYRIPDFLISKLGTTPFFLRSLRPFAGNPFPPIATSTRTYAIQVKGPSGPT